MVYVIRIAAGRAIGGLGLLMGAVGVALISLGYAVEGAKPSCLND